MYFGLGGTVETNPSAIGISVRRRFIGRDSSSFLMASGGYFNGVLFRGTSKWKLERKVQRLRDKFGIAWFRSAGL